MKVANKGERDLFLSNSAEDQSENSDPPFVKSVVLSQNGKTMTFFALIDTGAQGSIFIDTNIAQQIYDGLEISPTKLLKPKRVREYNSSKSDIISHTIFPMMTISNHTQNLIPMMITRMIQHDMIIGKT